MKLQAAQVTKFRNFDDSDVVTIEADVTALIGKNESGKTAFLQALYRLNPVYGEPFDPLEHYPRWLYTKDRKRDVIDNTTVITATFAIDEDDRAAFDDAFGEGVVMFDTVTIGRCYSNTLWVDWHGSLGEAAAVATVVERAQVGDDVPDKLARVDSFSALVDQLDAIAVAAEPDPATGSEGEPTATADIARVRSSITEMVGEDGLDAAVRTLVAKRLPRFFYFGEYNFLSGRTDLRRLAAGTDLNPGEHTAKALLRLAGADDDALTTDDYESRTSELEAVSNDLTDEMAEYWSQSQDLEVTIDVDKLTETTPEGTQAVARFLEVRVKDRRHGHTNSFDARSTGFRWFFSFLAAFSEYEADSSPIIILLDEPAVSLHARAQKDFLRFIDERLAPSHQVVFTTHSPFMVEPGRLNRARLVEDKGAKTGSKITADALATDRDTLFPLQAALGYDVAQNLFITPHNLLTEGTSDFTYLHVLSDHLVANGRRGLDERWSVLPVGSVTKVATFVALLGQHLDVTVLVDAGSENQEVASLVRKGALEKSRFITPAAITGGKEADIEDLFEVDEYLDLYNAVIGDSPLAATDLNGSDRLIKRIERARGRFNHGLPADWLLRNRDSYLGKLSTATLDRFEQLFDLINATLPD